jgi:hypothetical protein
VPKTVPANLEKPSFQHCWLNVVLQQLPPVVVPSAKPAFIVI